MSKVCTNYSKHFSFLKKLNKLILRLKLTMSINKGYSMSLLSNHQTLDVLEKGSEMLKDSLRSPSAQRSLADSQKSTQNTIDEGDFYNLNSFYTLLNKTDISCCSRKKTV